MKATRRTMIKSSIGALGLAAGGFCPLFASARFSPAKPASANKCISHSTNPIQSDVIIEGVRKNSEGDAIGNAIRAAAEAATDFSWLKKGDAVLIKPANNSGRRYPSTTHPESIASMITLLKEKGAGRVIVSDMAGIQHVELTKTGLRGSTRKLMIKNGIFEAAIHAGAEMYFPEEHGWSAFFEDGPAQISCWKNGVMVPGILKEVDHIVLMPRTSRHVLAGSTLGLKCAVGYIRFDSRLEYHHDADTLFEKHVGINTLPSLKSRLRLVITTATKLLVTFGPDSGQVYEPDTGLVIASTDITSHDMVSLAWLEIGRRHCPSSWPLLLNDPYEHSDLAVDLMNRSVVFMLGGIREARTAQNLARYNTENLWLDPTLGAAFKIFGFTPDIRIVNPRGSVPDDIKNELEDRTRYMPV